MNKVKYEIDPHNRLIFSGTSNKKGPLKFRKILEGRFKTDKNNVLTYHIKKPAGRDLPQQIKLNGTWSLDKDHNLKLSLNKWNKDTVGSLTIKGELIDVKAGSLAFAVTTKSSPSRDTTYILKLKGTWRADKYNRLSFIVRDEKGREDHLTFNGRWNINKKNSITYTYKKSRLRTKRKELNLLTFKGYWDITKKHRLTYILNKKTNSSFDFRINTGKALENGMLYEIGIGLNRALKKIIISGKWKINKNIGLLLEIQYENGRTKNIVFGASCRAGKNSELDIKLKNRKGKDLDLNLKISKTLFKGEGSVYLTALLSGKEKKIIIGAGLLW